MGIRWALPELGLKAEGRGGWDRSSESCRDEAGLQRGNRPSSFLSLCFQWTIKECFSHLCDNDASPGLAEISPGAELGELLSNSSGKTQAEAGQGGKAWPYPAGTLRITVTMAQEATHGPDNLRGIINLPRWLQ